MQGFSIKEAVRFGWVSVVDHPLLSISLFLTPLLTISVFLVAASLVQVDSLAAFILLPGIIVAEVVLALLFRIGIIKAALEIVNGRLPSLLILVSEYRYFWKFLVAGIIFSFAFTVGIVLLVIPGLIVIVRYGFFPFILIDRNTEPLESLKQSFEMTRGSGSKIFLFYLALGSINILGLLCAGIGLLVTLPLTVISVAYVYRKLSSQNVAV